MSDNNTTTITYRVYVDTLAALLPEGRAEDLSRYYSDTLRERISERYPDAEVEIEIIRGVTGGQSILVDCYGDDGPSQYQVEAMVQEEANALLEQICTHYGGGNADIASLCTISTKDEAGRHYTERYSRDLLDRLAERGWIIERKPVHEGTGLPYSEEYWWVEVTELGQDTVDTYGELHPYS